MKTPVLLVAYKRPDSTLKVLETIRKAGVKKLFVACNAPNPAINSDLAKCKQVKDIINNIDWDCEVKSLFRTEHLSCGKSVSSAITWFFDNVEEGIILEDDCVPDNSFFGFCEYLLEYHKNNPRIMHISGNNFQRGKRRGDASYYYSKYPHIWGWATWRRAWRFFDYEMKEFEFFKKKLAENSLFKYKKEENYWLKILQNWRETKKPDTWDFQWCFALWNYGGIAILPANNLVTNIGFNEDATHTFDDKSSCALLPSQEICIRNHPYNFSIDHKADYYTFKNNFSHDEPGFLFHRIWNFFIRRIKN